MTVEKNYDMYALVCFDIIIVVIIIAAISRDRSQQKL